jgi:hypothetical protein
MVHNHSPECREWAGGIELCESGIGATHPVGSSLEGYWIIFQIILRTSMSVREMC